MGGKSYFCDYCQCYMKNDINVRKTHNSGLMHNIAKANYMRRYEDPQQILEKESAKVPCTRFLKGYCKFGFFCQFSHYSASQLKEIREIVEKLQQSQTSKTSHIKTTNRKRKKKKRHRTLKYRNLPPSLRPANFIINKFQCQWG